VLANYAVEEFNEEEYFKAGDTNLVEEPKAPLFTDSLLSVKTKAGKKGNATTSPRRSNQSKAIGDEAELYVLHLLTSNLVPNVNATNVKHVANEKLGWDIEYTDKNGEEIKVEVKGSVASKFLNFELTENELTNLKKLDSSYHIYLVASCMSKSKKVQIIEDMNSRMYSGKASASPVIYRVELLDG